MPDLHPKFDPAAPLDPSPAEIDDPTWERVAIAFGLWVFPLANLLLSLILIVLVVR